MIVGQVAYVAVSYFIGGALSTFVDQLIAFASKYLWESTITCLSLVGGYQAVSYWRRRRAVRRVNG